MTFLYCIRLLHLIIIYLCSRFFTSAADNAAGSGGGVYGGRHSYSLSTFSPSGSIDQVVRAMRASMLGVPIVALSIPSSADVDDDEVSISHKIDSCNGSTQAPSTKTVVAKTIDSSSRTSSLPTQGGIYLSIPLRFLTTSPLLVDDGTPRIVQITSMICLAHTGVGADGRALCDMAISMALDYRYVYGEEISVEELLEGLAEKVQEMTMKVGSRPFGSALFVGCLGRSDDDDDDDDGHSDPTMYRVDPSGAVTLLNSSSNSILPTGDKYVSRQSTGDSSLRRGSVAFLGNWDALRQKKDDIRSQLERCQYTNEEEVQDVLIDAARQTYMIESSISSSASQDREGKVLVNQRPALFASFTRERGLQISRIL